jgi:tetratricopeptide (TPR) repeat protein
MRVFLAPVLLGVMLSAAAIATVSEVAHADPAPVRTEQEKTDLAKKYTNAGIAAQDAGDFETAIELYTKAFQLVPHPLLIFNVAQANRLAGHKERAVVLYRRYLELDPNGAQAQTARDLINELDPPKPPPPPPPPVAQPKPATAPPPKAVTVPPPAPAPAAEPAPAPVDTSTSVSAESDAPRDHRLAWEISLGASAAVAIAGFAYAGYAYSKANAGNVTYGGNIAPTPSDCGNANSDYTAISRGSTVISILSPNVFKHGCDWRPRVAYGYAVAGVGVIGAAISSYMLFLHNRESHEQTAHAHAHRPQHDVVVVPVITPQTSGAQLSITF